MNYVWFVQPIYLSINRLIDFVYKRISSKFLIEWERERERAKRILFARNCKFSQSNEKFLTKREWCKLNEKNFTSSNEIIWDYCIPDSFRIGAMVHFSVDQSREIETDHTTEYNSSWLYKQANKFSVICAGKQQCLNAFLFCSFAKTDDVICHAIWLSCCCSYWMKCS